MTKTSLCVLGSLAAISFAASAAAQPSTTYEKGTDGVTWQVTRQVVPRSIPVTEYQTQQQKVYRPQATVAYQTYRQNYATPVTEYQWVPRLHGWWNPFQRAYWKHELRPVTRWQTASATVQMPVTRTDWVEETRTAQVPVTTYRTVNEEYTSRVAVSAAPSTSPAGSPSAVANRYGDKPAQSTPPPAAGSSYRR